MLVDRRASDHAKISVGRSCKVKPKDFNIISGTLGAPRSLQPAPSRGFGSATIGLRKIRIQSEVTWIRKSEND